MNESTTTPRDFAPYLLAFGGACILALITADAAIWVGGLFVAAAIYWQYRKTSRKDTISDSDIDGVYYFGFIITIVTLVLTIFNIAHIKNISDHSTQIITQFGIGLAFTAIALLFRMRLLVTEENRKGRTANEATDELTQKLDRLTHRFDQLSQNITTLAENAQIRSHSLLDTFEATEFQFNTRLNAAADLLERSAANSTAQLRQAETEFNAAAQRAQEREQRLAKEFSQALGKFNEYVLEVSKASLANTSDTIDIATERFSDTINALIKNTQARELQQAQAFDEAVSKFRAHLADTTKDSLEETSDAIDLSIRRFTGAIDLLGSQVERLRGEIQALDFKDAAGRLETFIKSMESALGSVQSAVDGASRNAAEAIGKLAASAQDTHTLAVEIAANLDSLRNLEALVGRIAQAGEGLERISIGAAHSSTSLMSLAQETREATAASSGLDQGLRGTSTSLTGIATESEAAASSIAELNRTARKTQEMMVEIAASLKASKTAKPAWDGQSLATTDTPLPKKPWYSMTVKETYRTIFRKKDKGR